MSFLQVLTVRPLCWKLPTATAVCIVLSWLGQHELKAQRIFVRVGGGQAAKLELYNQLNNILEGKRDAAKNRLGSLLLDIDLACELTPKQRTRFEIAAKGAIKSYSNKIVEKLKKQARAAGFEFTPDNPPQKDPNDEQDNDDLVPQGARLLNLGDGPNGELTFTIETENIWTTTVEKTLTKPQVEKLESWIVAREKLIQQAAVDHLIAKADLKMFLTLEQRQKLKAYLHKEYGPQLVKQMIAPAQKQQGFVLVGVPQSKLDIEVHESLKEFLKEPQLEIWKMDFQDDLDSLDGEGFGLRNFLGR